MAKRQPPILHIGNSVSPPFLCDAERTESWPDKYLDDAVARTLEVCESCLGLLPQLSRQNPEGLVDLSLKG